MYGAGAVRTGPRSQRRPRSGLWGVQVLHSQQHVHQDELDALEALCFLSAGVSHVKQQLIPKTTSQPASKRQRALQSKQAHSKSKQTRRQAKKQHSRRSLGSETSSGATQCGLTSALASQLQGPGAADLLMPLEDIHPAALPPALPQLQLLLAEKQQEPSKQSQQQQQESAPQLQQGAESSDTRQLLSTPSDDYAAQSRQCTPGVHVVPCCPGPVNTQQQQQQHVPQSCVHHHHHHQQQQQVGFNPVSPHASFRPATQPHACQVEGQQPAALSKPPVKGCWWHVHIAKMIQADQRQKEQQQQQKRGSPQPSQQGEPAAPAAAAKKRRVEQQPSRQVVAPAAPGRGAVSCVGSAAAQQAAAMQQLLLQTVLQPPSPPAARVSPMLPQQAPTPLQLLQVVSAAAGLTGALAPKPQMASAHPAGVTALASKSQLLQALCPALPAAGPQAVLAAQAMAAAGLVQGGRLAPGRGSVPGLARPLTAGQGPWGPAATGVLGLMQGIAASGAAGYAPAAPAAAQLQALLGTRPGMGQLTGLVRGM